MYSLSDFIPSMTPFLPGLRLWAPNDPCDPPTDAAALAGEWWAEPPLGRHSGTHQCTARRARAGPVCLLQAPQGRSELGSYYRSLPPTPAVTRSAACPGDIWPAAAHRPLPLPSAADGNWLIIAVFTTHYSFGTRFGTRFGTKSGTKCIMRRENG